MVVLNFITYEDTYKLIYSLNEQLLNTDINIYIVDNNSDDEKYKLLQEKLKKLMLPFKIIYLISSNNLGFARGMNIGINKAMEDNCDFVVCSNNDIYFSNKINLHDFSKIYDKNNNIGVIGPKIINKNNINENPYMINNPIKQGQLEKLKQKFIFSNFLGKCIFLLRAFVRSFLYRDSHIKQKMNESNPVYCLHGAFFVLTPSYFKFYKNLDPNTFLYVEELILAKRIENQGLIEYYTTDVEINHIDDSSTNKMLGGDSFKKIKFISNENYKSLKYFMKEYIWKK